MYKSGSGLKPSEDYADRLRLQLEECSLDGVGCELCANENACRRLYDMVPIFISENDYQKYSRGFIGLRLTKETRHDSAS